LKLAIYPQPVTTRFRVDIPNVGDEGEYFLQILDLNGRKVREERFSGTGVTLERGNLQNGVYVIRVVSETTGKIYVDKLIAR